MIDIAGECKRLLLEHNVDSASNIDFDVNGKVHSMSFEYIIDVYMQASEESRLVFYSALEKSLNAGEIGVENFFEGMGQLLLMSHLSEKFEG
jgi:hypothetical protein